MGVSRYVHNYSQFLVHCVRIMTIIGWALRKVFLVKGVISTMYRTQPRREVQTCHLFQLKAIRSHTSFFFELHEVHGWPVIFCQVLEGKEKKKKKTLRPGTNPKEPVKLYKPKEITHRFHQLHHLIKCIVKEIWVCKISSSQNFLSDSVRNVYLHCRTFINQSKEIRKRQVT